MELHVCEWLLNTTCLPHVFEAHQDTCHPLHNEFISIMLHELLRRDFSLQRIFLKRQCDVQQVTTYRLIIHFHPRDEICDIFDTI